MSVLVLWDVDYTLLNAGELGNRLYLDVSRQLLGHELIRDVPKAGRTERAIALDTLAQAGVPEPREQVDALLAALARKAAALDGELPAPVVPLPGAAAVIAALATHGGIYQSVLTGNIRALAELKLRAAGLTEHLDLDAGAYGDAHEDRADLVDVARQAAKARFGADFSGEATVLIGDTPLDVEAALARGARVVAVATGSYSQSELADAHAVLPDLTDTAALLAAVGGLRPGRREDAALQRPRHRQALAMTAAAAGAWLSGSSA